MTKIPSTVRWDFLIGRDEKFADEIMSEEELDEVAGGTLKEMVKDTKFLHALGLMDHAYSAKQIQADPVGVSDLINKAFGDVGNMWAESWSGGKNMYGMIDGDSFNRATAYKKLAAKVKPGFNYKKYL